MNSHPAVHSSSRWLPNADDRYWHQWMRWRYCERRFARCVQKRPFTVDAMVVLPDHLHCIWTLPPGDADFATRWRLIKTWFTRHVDAALHSAVNTARARKGEQAVWQHRYWEHLLRDERDFIRHVEYIHFNPVKHGYVLSPIEWPYSSFGRYVEDGRYAQDWGCCEMDFSGVGHE